MVKNNKEIKDFSGPITLLLYWDFNLSGLWSWWIVNVLLNFCVFELRVGLGFTGSLGFQCIAPALNTSV